MPLEQNSEWTPQRRHPIMFNSISWQTKCFSSVWPEAVGIHHLKYQNLPSLSYWFTARLRHTQQHIDIYTQNQIQLYLFPPLPSHFSFSSLHLLSPFYLSLHFLHLPFQSPLISNFFLPSLLFPSLLFFSCSLTLLLLPFITLFVFLFFSLSQTFSLSCSFTSSLFIWWLSGWWYRLS